MLQCLRHHALIRRNHEQTHIYSTSARKHILEEALMSRNIHDSCNSPIRELQSGKPDIDGHAALLLLFKPIGIGPCERLDQRGFPMIDMPGSSDDYVFHG